MLIWLVFILAAGGVWAVIYRTERDLVKFPSDRNDLLKKAIKVTGGQYIVGSREADCHPRRIVIPDTFYMWPTEVPRVWWHQYNGYLEKDKRASNPVAAISYNEAEMFCRWLSERYDIVARLPTIDEWEVAARSGTPGVTYPWGWDEPSGRANFDASSTVDVQDASPNPWGFYHMSGNVAEWCQADPDEPRAFVMGGSWAERDPRYVRISHRLSLDKSYRDEDVGFRFVFVMPPDPQKKLEYYDE